MAREARDSAVTEYVRHRLEQLKASGAKGIELAAKMGVSASSISQIAKDQGIGSRSISKFAAGLKFADAADLRRTAYDWYTNQMASASGLLEEPAVKEAVANMVISSGVTAEHLMAILTAFVHPRFRGRPSDYWMTQLGLELRFERQLREHVELGEQRENQHQKIAQNAVRDGFRRKAREKKGKTDDDSTKRDSSPRSRRRAGGVQ